MSNPEEDIGSLGSLTEDEMKYLKQIRESKKKTFNVRIEKWLDAPPLLDMDNWMHEIIADYDTEDSQNAQIGQTYVNPMTRGRRVQVPKDDSEEPQMKDIILNKGLEIWNVIQPKKLERMPDGNWFSERWVPKVKDDVSEQWREAHPSECENWENLLLNRKRVDYLAGILPDV